MKNPLLSFRGEKGGATDLVSHINKINTPIKKGVIEYKSENKKTLL
jgi:hypothetical protein